MSWIFCNDELYSKLPPNLNKVILRELSDGFGLMEVRFSTIEDACLVIYWYLIFFKLEDKVC